MNKLNNFLNLTPQEIESELKIISQHFDIFPNENRSFTSEYLELFKKYDNLETMTFFGGTFNPIHLGHIECLKLCPEKNITMILDRNPHKELREINYKDEISTILKRTSSLNVSIYPGFWFNEEKNPTSKWITSAKVKEKNLLMGDDSFISFLSWTDPQLILNSLSKLYVVPRNHQLHQLAVVRDICKSMNPKLEIIFLSNHEYQNVSSTDIRNKTN